MRGATIIWAVLVTIAATGLFTLKYQVQAQEQRLAGLHRDILRSQENIHVLRAEWSFLNEPARLRELAERHLGMHSLKPGQIALLDSLPMADPRPAEAAPGFPNEGPVAEDANPPVAATVALPSAPAMVPAAQPAAKPVQAAKPVAKAPAPMHQAPPAKIQSAARKADTPVAVALAKPVTKTVAVAQAKPPVVVAQAKPPVARPAPSVVAAYPSYPKLQPTYTNYPSTAAQTVSSGNVMVIQSPAMAASDGTATRSRP